MTSRSTSTRRYGPALEGTPRGSWARCCGRRAFAAPRPRTRFAAPYALLPAWPVCAVERAVAMAPRRLRRGVVLRRADEEGVGPYCCHQVGTMIDRRCADEDVLCLRRVSSRAPWRHWHDGADAGPGAGRGRARRSRHRAVHRRSGQTLRDGPWRRGMAAGSTAWTAPVDRRTPPAVPSDLALGAPGRGRSGRGSGLAGVGRLLADACQSRW